MLYLITESKTAILFQFKKRKTAVSSVLLDRFSTDFALVSLPFGPKQFKILPENNDVSVEKF